MPRGVKISVDLKQRIIAAHRERERQSDITRRTVGPLPKLGCNKSLLKMQNLPMLFN